MAGEAKPVLLTDLDAFALRALLIGPRTEPELSLVLETYTPEPPWVSSVFKSMARRGLVWPDGERWALTDAGLQALPPTGPCDAGVTDRGGEGRDDGAS